MKERRTVGVGWVEIGGVGEGGKVGREAEGSARGSPSETNRERGREGGREREIV